MIELFGCKLSDLIFLFLQKKLKKKHSDTEQLMDHKMRVTEAKRLFIILGISCICLVIALLFFLYALDYEENALNDHLSSSLSSSSNSDETFDFETISTTRVENIQQKRHDDSEQNRVKFIQFKRLKRFKRQLSLNPIHYSEQLAVKNTRRKRLSEQLEEVKLKFEQCRNSNANPNDCESFFRQMVDLSEALNHEIQRMQNFDRSYDRQAFGSDQVNHENNFRQFSDMADPLRDPMQELMREEKVLQGTNGFSSFPKFHEELHNRHSSAWNVNDQLHNGADKLITPFETNPRDNEKITPLKTQNPNFGK